MPVSPCCLPRQEGCKTQHRRPCQGEQPCSHPALLLTPAVVLHPAPVPSHPVRRHLCMHGNACMSSSSQIAWPGCTCTHAACELPEFISHLAPVLATAEAAASLRPGTATTMQLLFELPCCKPRRASKLHSMATTSSPCACRARLSRLQVSESSPVGRSRSPPLPTWIVHCAMPTTRNTR